MQTELALVMQSPEFVRSPVLRRLLQYLVDQTLAGNGERLKAYQIAVDGLGRDDSFDPQSDSYPRVQVGRLRKMLDLHYAGLSAQEAALRQRISIPVGRYNVELLSMAEPEAAASPDEVTDAPPVSLPPAPGPAILPGSEGPTAMPAEPKRIGPKAGGPAWLVWALGILVMLAVLYILWMQFGSEAARQDAAQRDLRAELAHVSIVTDPANGTDDLNTAAQIAEMHLQRFEMLAVRTLAHEDETRVVPREYTLLLRGGGQSGGSADRPIFLTLRHEASGTTLWSYEVKREGTRLAAADIEQAIGIGISALARTGGVIAQHQRKLMGNDLSPGYPCLIAYDVFRQRRDPAERPQLDACLRNSLERYPDEPLILQALSFLELTKPRKGSKVPLMATPRGRELAEAALRADGKSALAQVAVARSALARGNCSRAIAYARRAAESNPLEPDTVGLSGSILMSCGDFVGAEPMLERASLLNEQPGGFQVPSLILTRLINGKRESALQLALSADLPELEDQPNFLLGKALALAANGRMNEARSSWQAMEKAAGVPPGTRAADTIARFIISPFLASRLLTEIEAVGLAAPQT